VAEDTVGTKAWSRSGAAPCLAEWRRRRGFRGSPQEGVTSPAPTPEGTALAEGAEREQWSYAHFLAVLFAEEVAHRTQTRLSRLTHKACFPSFKTIDDFDFTFQSTLRLEMLGSYLSPDFVTDGRTLTLNGKSSRRKTHLAIAIAYRAIQNGFEAMFTTAAAPIEDLSRASAERRLRDALVAYTHPHVLVVDEVGYLSYGHDAANVLYHVVNARHLRRRAMVFTNQPG